MSEKPGRDGVNSKFGIGNIGIGKIGVGKKRLLLIDGHSMAYRAFYALPEANFTTSSGQATNAIYGFASMLINLIRDEAPTHIATAFDVSRVTFRSEKFPAYKATRSATPDTFRSQLPHLYQLLEAFGIPYFEQPGYEADDIIATLAYEARENGFETLICTGDRDAFQLVQDGVTVLYPKKGVTELARMTPAAIEEKYGITPSQYPDFAALRGDPSDNLPSIPGVGEKTAVKWIVEYGSLTELIAKIDQIAGKVGDALRAHISSVLLNRELTQLRHDVALGVHVDELRWSGIWPTKVNAILDELEIKALKPRLKNFPQQESTNLVVSDGSELKQPAMVTILDISAEKLSSLLANRSEPIAISYESLGNLNVNYAVALSESEVYRVLGEGFGEWLHDSSLPKYLHGAKALARLHGLSGLAVDTQLAAYLINPGSRALDLLDLAERILGETNQSDDGLFSEFDAKQAAWIYQLVPILKKQLKEQEALHLLLEVEQPLTLLLATMERVGIAVNRSSLEEQLALLRQTVALSTASAHKAAGREFNVASPKQLQQILFEELKLPKTKKIKTGYTTDADALAWLHEQTHHPVLTELLRIREAGKLATTIEGLLSAIGPDSRIHTSFQQTVAATGRLSSIEPNLQNIPVRTEEGRKIRNCFVPGDGFESLLTADYSQIELRIMAHLSQDDHLKAAFASGEDLHTTVATNVFGVSRDEVTPEMRRRIKAMSYGLAYGLSAYGLGQQLDLSPKEASALMDRYFERFGGIRDYLQSVVAEARKTGYTETLLGRRRYLPDLNHENRQRREVAERMALNAPIQGTAADIIKIAMLNVQRDIEKSGLRSRLLVQVHDELICEIYPGEAEQLSELVQRKMSDAYRLDVKLEVNVGIGKSWDLAAH